MALPNPFNPPPNTPLLPDPQRDSIWRRWFEQLWRRTQSGAMGGDVVGPASSTDNALARWDGATGKLLKNSGVIVDNSNNVSGVVNLTTTGNTILGDAAGDTITFNAAAWTYGNNIVATRAAGTLATGEQRLFNYEASATGDAGGGTSMRGFRSYLETQGANNLTAATAMLYIAAHNGSGTATTLRGVDGQARLLSSGNVTFASAYAGFIDLRSTGSITAASTFLSSTPSITGAGTITRFDGLLVQDAASSAITTVNGVFVQDQTLATGAMSAARFELSAGSGKKNLNITGTADNALAGPLYLAQDDKTQQTAAAMYAGTGAPNNANGNNGDFYLRGDGGAGTYIYHKAAGAWTGIV